MRILIATGLSKTDIGGPFQYAHNLEQEFRNFGHEVKVISYGSLEKSLPPWVRHLYFLFRILPSVVWAEKILALDTYSVGVPTVFAAKFCGKKVVIRVGGDFLWSAYVNRTNKGIPLPAFYKDMPELNLKERLIFFFTKFTVNRTDFLAFNTEWQRAIWRPVYKLNDNNSGVVRNFIPTRSEGNNPSVKNLLWAGRAIPEKNLEFLKKAGQSISEKYPEFRLDIVTNEPHEKIIERTRDCYAVISVAFTDICPNSVIEGASFTKPFIMTKETGFNEIFPKGGIFIDPLNQKELQDAIETILNDNTYNRLVEELKANKATHTWDELARGFLKIWETT